MAALSNREIQIAERIAWGLPKKKLLMILVFLAIPWIIFFVRYIKNFISVR